jgi:hypothetical protein
LGNWNDPVAQIRKIEVEEGESFLLVPGGQGVVYSLYQVIPVDIGPVASGGPALIASLPITIPNQLRGGMVMLSRQNTVNYMAEPIPWLFKVGSMAYNLATDASLTSTIVDPAITFNSEFLCGPNYQNVPGAQVLSTGAPSTQRFWNNAAALNALPIADAGDDLSRPIWVTSTIAGDTLFINTLMIALIEIPGAFAAQFVTGAVPNNLMSGWANALNTLYIMINRPRHGVATENDAYKTLFYIPNWTLAAGNVLLYLWAVDYANGAIVDRVGGGYAPRALRPVSLGSATHAQPVLSGTPVTPSNLQPL